MPEGDGDLDVDVEGSRPPARRRMGRRGDHATWEVVAILIVLAVILVLAAEGAGLISR